MSYETVKVHRGDLYEMVWSAPISTLSPTYGISDVGFKKVCTRLHVPTPPRGYWIKLRHGHDVSRTPLPELPEGAPEVHTFYVCEEGARAITMRQAPKADEAPSLEIRRTIKVPATLRSPHPLVAATRDALKKRRPDTRGRVSTFGEETLDVKVCPASVSRALRVLDTVLKEAERLKFTTVPGPGRKTHVRLVIEGEEVPFRIFEKVRQKELPLDADAPSWRRRNYEYIPTGNLRIELTEAYRYGGRKVWSDGKSGQVESQIAAFLSGAYDAALAEQRDRERRKIEEERRKEAERRRQEEQQRRRDEEARRQELERQAERWRRSQQLSAYVDEVERQVAEETLTAEQRKKCDAWLQWARTHAERLNPLSARLPFRCTYRGTRPTQKGPTCHGIST